LNLSSVPQKVYRLFGARVFCFFLLLMAEEGFAFSVASLADALLKRSLTDLD